MEWLESMLKNHPQAEENLVDDEDFYGEGANGAQTPAAVAPQDALPGAAQDGTGLNANKFGFNIPTTPGPSNPQSGAGANAQNAEQRKLENQRKAEQLRAKLIANRQNTPIRVNTPNKLVPKIETPQESVVKQVVEDTPTQNSSHDEQQSDPSSDILGIDALLQEGQAAAEAKARAEDLAKVDLSSTNGQPTRAAEPKVAAIQQQQPPKQGTLNKQQPEQPTVVTDHLATEYYADLSIWLEMTGYHDIDYRNSKLRMYKERKALEEEAARIQERLEKLKQDEQAEMSALRASSAHPVATPSRPPPALPTAMNATDAMKPADKKPFANGNKRAHSPEPMLSEKNARPREDANNGIRIRGANDSPQDRAHVFGRDRGRSPLGRRISYPDARRQDSFGEPKDRMSRDASLERRQAYYGRDDDGARGRERFEHPPQRDNGGRGRMGFSAVNVQQERPYRESYPAPPHVIRDVDAGRGANVRYFMIKSWNAENVATAMRDSLWSTQEKNERLLADAYHSSRAVVLCFSVNNSKAFQGYALMTSPPDPLLPKPAFCAKLNWPTSPAFTLTWLATAPVHFRHVGHIKNELNLDDSGHPSAVLVGKDGQEIAPEAGRGLCEILDEVQAVEGPGGAVGGGGGGKGRGR